jgi:hypothetical protein
MIIIESNDFNVHDAVNPSVDAVSRLPPVELADVADSSARIIGIRQELPASVSSSVVDELCDAWLVVPPSPIDPVPSATSFINTFPASWPPPPPPVRVLSQTSSAVPPESARKVYWIG